MSKLNNILSVSLFALIGTISSINNAYAIDEIDFELSGSACVGNTLDVISTSEFSVDSSFLLDPSKKLLASGDVVQHLFEIKHDFSDIFTDDTTHPCYGLYEVELDATSGVDILADSGSSFTNSKVVFTSGGTSKLVIDETTTNTTSELKLTLDFTHAAVSIPTEVAYKIPVKITAEIVTK